MKTVRYVLGCCVLLLAPSAARSDACTDLQAAIAKAAALKQEMQRKAAPLVSSPNMPAHDQGVCTAAQNLRNHIVTVMQAGLINDPKCLSEEQHRSLTGSLNASMDESSKIIGLFCP